MQNIGVFFGSRAAEHDVSIISGLQILENADKAKYNVFPVYVSRKGEWFVGEPLKNVETYKHFDENMKGLTKVYLPPVPGMGGLYANASGLFAKAKLVCPMDCAILAFHGMNGEDGTMQGLMELADMPYSSCGVLGSAVGMDKIVMKAVFKSMGLNVLDGTYCYRDTWHADREKIIAEAEKIGYPVYVKPANLGSSIGISRAADRESFIKAMDTACAYDKRILIEKGLEKPREINCACLGMGADCIASLCEEPVSWEEFLTFDSKYIMSAGKAYPRIYKTLADGSIYDFEDEDYDAFPVDGRDKVTGRFKLKHGESLTILNAAAKNKPITVKELDSKGYLTSSPGSISFIRTLPLSRTYFSRCKTSRGRTS